MKVNLPDQDLHIGVRPEGFIVSEKGKLSLDLLNIEVMGRDSSIVATHSASQNDIVRAIVQEIKGIDLSNKEVKFNLKPNKVFVFDIDSEERIYSEGE